MSAGLAAVGSGERQTGRAAMHAEAIVSRLERFPHALRGAVCCVTPEQARWKPESGAWSVLEVVGHLCDEEVHDFRARLRHVTGGASGLWPPIDPEGWSRERRYNEQDLTERLECFARERAASVSWLRSLPGVDWGAAYQHPKFGAIRAGDLLAAWGAHDALHLRQIAKRLFELAARDAGAFSTAYAGEWKA